MAQSEKIFRDLLCEGRSQSVDTTDPTGALKIDELKRTVSRLKAELEAERLKSKQTQRDYEKDLKRVREEAELKLATSLDAASSRKDLERVLEVRKVEEKLVKQSEQDLRQLRRDKEEELRRVTHRLERERDEAVRLSVEQERRKASDQMQQMLPEDESAAREARLAKEVFLLAEQNERLEDQVRSLSRENRNQIELLRRMKHEHDAEVGSVIKQHQLEASREMAQLKLAERIIAEKEQDLHALEYRASQVELEKEALTEELLHAKSVGNTSILDPSTASQGASPATPFSKHMAGPGVLLQKRVEELEVLVRRLEEERSEAKQENASLRKKLAQGQGSEGEGKGGKQSDDKLKKLRKRNADLVALAKQLDERCKALKQENEQLQKQTVLPGDAEQQVRKTLSRQHARDITEYTRQLHSKEREIESLKKQLAKEAAPPKPPRQTPKEPPGELEKRLSAMALEGLRMDKLLCKLYTKLPELEDVEEFSRKELGAELQRAQQLVEENRTLRQQLGEAVKEGKDEVDAGEALREENKRLSAQVQQLAKFEQECSALRSSQQELEESSTAQRKELQQVSQQLKIATVAVGELEGVQEHCEELEAEVAQVRGQLNQKDTELRELELECQNAISLHAERQEEMEALNRTVLDLESVIADKDQHSWELQSSLEELQVRTRPPQVTETGVQTEISGTTTVVQQEAPKTEAVLPQARPEVPHSHAAGEKKRRPDSSGRRRSRESPVHKDLVRLRINSPKPGSVGEQESNLECEMRAAGVEITDSFDSSECVGFSDATLDDTLHDAGSAVSLESLKSDRTVHEREGPKEHPPGDEGKERESERQVKLEEETQPGREDAVSAVTQREEQPEPVPEPAAPVTGSQNTTAQDPPCPPDGQPATTGEVVGGAVGKEIAVANLEDLGDTTSSEEVNSSSSEGDLPALKRKSATPRSTPEAAKSAVQDSKSPALEVEEATPTAKVAVFIAKYTYTPSEMSPNPNYEQELAISAGDYLYVFGEMDEDGFYQGQLMNGETGLVPSNFIERVMDDTENVSPQPPRKGGHRRKLSNLQDIAEEDEDSSSGGSIRPPQNLELERQFVDGDKYSVVVEWNLPDPLPPGATGFAVYVNGEVKARVEGAGQRNVLLSEVPRHQLVKISVRTVTEEGESPDPKKLIILNPQYPEPPAAIRLSKVEEPRAILVEWSPSQPVQGGNPITGYLVMVDGQRCVNLAANESPTDQVCTQVLANDLRHLKLGSNKHGVGLTVRALVDSYASVDSSVMQVSRELLDHVLRQQKGEGTMLGPDESETSSLSSCEDKEDSDILSPARKAGPGHVTEAVDQVTKVVDHVTEPVDHVTEPVDHVTKPVDQVTEAVDHVTEAVDRVTEAVDHVTEPVDHVTEAVAHVTEPVDHVTEAVAHVTEPVDHVTEAVAHVTEATDGATEETDHMANGTNFLENLAEDEDDKEEAPLRYYRALYAYNPYYHSPNDEGADEELCFIEGDIIVAKAGVDEDGFFEGELNGKQGLVPENMVEEITAPEELAQMQLLLAAQAAQSHRRGSRGSRANPGSRLPAMNGGHTPPLDGLTRRMIALYDYTPAKDSPNPNPEEELAFVAGDVLVISGEADSDGFLQGELRGKFGLVPSTFVGDLADEQEVFAADEEDVRKAEKIIENAAESLRKSESPTNSTAGPKRKGLLSRGKDMLSKGLGKRKDSK